MHVINSADFWSQIVLASPLSCVGTADTHSEPHLCNET